MSPPRPQQRRPPRTPTPPTPPTTTLILVWDLDGSLILDLDSLASRPEAGDSRAREAGSELRRCVLDLAARRFHLDTLGGGSGAASEEEEEEEEEEGGVGVGSGSGKKSAELKLLAAEACSAYDSGPRLCLSAEAALEAARARSAVDAVSGGWLRAASRLLAETSSSSSSSSFAFRHFVVTAAPLAPTLAKLMVCGLSEFFPSAAVRCCWKKKKKENKELGSENGGCCRKAAAFAALRREVEKEQQEEEKVEEEKERRVLFLAVGNSLGDELAAEAAGWPFVRVGPRAVGKEFGNDDGEGGGGDAGGSSSSSSPSSSSPSSSSSSSSSSSATKGARLRRRPDALGRVSTPMTRLTLLDLMRAAGALGG